MVQVIITADPFRIDRRSNFGRPMEFHQTLFSPSPNINEKKRSGNETSRFPT